MAQTEAVMKTNEFHETFKVHAENIILHEFPKRIVHFYELLRKPEFCILENNIECKLQMPTIVKLENDVNNYEGESPHETIPEQILVPSNKNITEITEILKPNIVQLIEDNRTLKLWLTLLIPKIEDGNNFGVSVQKTILSLLQEVEAATNGYFEKLSQYYQYRGRLITKVLKYPFLEDYRIAVEELDEKQCTTISLIICDMFHCYIVLYDIINKNFDKIKNPRSNNADCLY